MPPEPPKSEWLHAANDIASQSYVWPCNDSTQWQILLLMLYTEMHGLLVTGYENRYVLFLQNHFMMILYRSFIAV